MKDHVYGFGFDPSGGWWSSWGPSAGRGRGRGGRRRWFGSGDMKYVILKMLADRPMHGYEVMKELAEQTHGCYKPSPGTVYPTLQWLEDEGLVSSEEQAGKKVYSVTDEGRAFLEENKSTVEDIFDRVDEMIDHVTSDPMPEVNRLVGRVVKEAYRASWRLRGDEEKRRRVGEILEKTLTDLRAVTRSDGDAEAKAG